MIATSGELEGGRGLYQSTIPAFALRIRKKLLVRLVDNSSEILPGQLTIRREK
jgi:hypothetical protein